MARRSFTLPRRLAFGAGVAALSYLGVVAWHRARYGRIDNGAHRHTLLDQFVPDPEVLEHHHINIDAPAAVALQAACEMRLTDSPLVRAIFRIRELALGGTPDAREHPATLLSQMQSIGWVILAEEPCREIVMGAATQPWLANPIFRSVAPADFAAFNEPGYVKIAWSLRADPVTQTRCVFHTETRVSTTDAQARTRFRRYWSFVAPGVELIRFAMLRPLKREAEQRAAVRAAPRTALTE